MLVLITLFKRFINSYQKGLAVADLEGGRAGSGPPFGRRTDAVTVLLISDNGTVLWRRHRQL